jgi:hypothetical protein
MKWILLKGYHGWEQWSAIGFHPGFHPQKFEAQTGQMGPYGCLRRTGYFLWRHFVTYFKSHKLAALNFTSEVTCLFFLLPWYLHWSHLMFFFVFKGTLKPLVFCTLWVINRCNCKSIFRSKIFSRYENEDFSNIKW